MRWDLLRQGIQDFEALRIAGTVRPTRWAKRTGDEIPGWLDTGPDGDSALRGRRGAGGPLPGPLPLFPADNWWNTDISRAPVDANSSAFISFVDNGSPRPLHPDFGSTASPGSVDAYGFPYIVVGADQPKKAVQFMYSEESDGVDHTTGQSFPFYPIPDEAITQPHWIESGPPGNVDLRSSADRHVLIVDRDNRYLYELYNVFYDGARWHAGSGAFFDMKANNRRPDGWTSSDAAGLAILPGLIRYDELFADREIGHAFRVTVRATNGYVYPASHRAGNNPLALPMGARLRLKPGVNLSGFSPELQRLFRAFKKYGLVVADNGSDMYISGTFDTRWVNGVYNADFKKITANDFEVIRLGYRAPQVTYFPHVATGGGFTTAVTLANTGTGERNREFDRHGSCRCHAVCLAGHSPHGGDARAGSKRGRQSFNLDGLGPVRKPRRCRWWSGDLPTAAGRCAPGDGRSFRFGSQGHGDDPRGQ